MFLRKLLVLWDPPWWIVTKTKFLNLPGAKAPLFLLDIPAIPFNVDPYDYPSTVN